MRTKYLFGVALMMMAACSKDEIVSERQDCISYSVTAETQTRAADSYCNNILPESFKVWARTADGSLYINGDVIKNENGAWTDQNGTRYWPDNKALDFYAQVNGDAEFNLNDGTPTFKDFTVNDDVTKQHDLIYSVSAKQTKPEDGKVVLNFRHALSQVCFKARNDMKNMQVEIKGVSVGHLTAKGTFTFPASSTDANYVLHTDTEDQSKALDTGVWAIPADAAYDKEYSVTPESGSIVLPAASGTVMNLTCPEDGHKNGFAQTLTLLPQKVEAWKPDVKATDNTFNGAYFLIDVVLSNVTKNEKGDVVTPVYTGKTAIPVSVNWEQGRRYIYTFVFDEGGNGGWTPTPEDPKPVLTGIKYDITVDDFIPVNGNGTATDPDDKPVLTFDYEKLSAELVEYVGKADKHFDNTANEIEYLWDGKEDTYVSGTPDGEEHYLKFTLPTEAGKIQFEYQATKAYFWANNDEWHIDVLEDDGTTWTTVWSKKWEDIDTIDGNKNPVLAPGNIMYSSWMNKYNGHWYTSPEISLGRQAKVIRLYAAGYNELNMMNKNGGYVIGNPAEQANRKDFSFAEFRLKTERLR